MPWDTVKLNDGHSIPTIGYGTWRIGNGQECIDQVDQAVDVGFIHVDTAQAYRNEKEAGKAIRESGAKRSDIFVTTKYSGLDGLDIETSINNSLKNLGLDYVDLYLIHHPRLAKPDIPTAWKKMEELRERGLVRSIGVSNFEVHDLAILLAGAKVVPAANQIMLHPYVFVRQLPILEYCTKHKIAIEAYSSLIPITHSPGGPVDGVIGAIAEREKVTPDQVLLAWAKAKGAIVITTSSKRVRLTGYLKAGDLALTTSDLAAIDTAGAKGSTDIPHADALVPFTAAPPVDEEKAALAATALATTDGLPVPVTAPATARDKARDLAFMKLLVLSALMDGVRPLADNYVENAFARDAIFYTAAAVKLACTVMLIVLFVRFVRAWRARNAVRV